MCNALVPLVSEPDLTILDPEGSEPDTPSPAHVVKTTPPLQGAAARPRIQPPQDEEPEDDVERAAKKPIRRKSSVGLIIGLAVGGVGLLLLVLVGGGVGLLLHFVRNKPIPQADWQTFTPPNGDCSVLMPGTPQSQPLTVLGLTVNKYLLARTREKAFFVVAFADLGPDPLQPNILEMMTNGERDHIMQTVKGTVTSETSITLGNLPGREFQISTRPRGTIIERIYLAKIGGTHRFYLVTAAGDNMMPNSSDAARLFDSFKITAPAVPPTFLNAAAQQDGPKPPVVNRPPANPQPNPPIVVNPPPANPRPNPPRIIPRPRPPRRLPPGR
jgi:hypothetical protein